MEEEQHRISDTELVDRLEKQGAHALTGLAKDKAKSPAETKPLIQEREAELAGGKKHYCWCC